MGMNIVGAGFIEFFLKMILKAAGLKYGFLKKSFIINAPLTAKAVKK